MKKISLSLLAICTTILLYAQQISGVVKDQKNKETLPFVIITNIQQSTKTQTNENGLFVIEANENDTLAFQFIGYKTLKTIANQSNEILLIPEVQTLQEVIISTNREKTLRTESPTAISVINETTITENKPTTIDQVLNQTPGVNMVNLGNEQHMMSIRQPINTNATYLYLEDGIPIRSSGVFNHNALLEINMADVSRVEIIRGPSSSMYGSEAVGGAVNFISHKASEKPSAGISLQGNNLNYKRSDFFASTTINKKLGIRLSGYYAQIKNGLVEHTDFQKFASNLSLNYKLNSKTDLLFHTSYINYESDMNGSLDSSRFFSKNYSSNQTFTNRIVEALRSKISVQQYWNDKSKTTATVYYRNNVIGQNPAYRIKDDKKTSGLSHGEINENKFYSLGGILQHKEDFNFLHATIIAGISTDYSPNSFNANYIKIHKNDQNIYDSFSKSDSLLANYYVNLSNSAFYANASIKPTNNLIFSAGVRYDYFIYQFKNELDSNFFSGVGSHTDVFQKMTPKLGIVYNVSDNLGLYANYSQGFLPPQVSQLYYGSKVPNLKPSYYNNYEIGTWFALFESKIKIDVAVYNMLGKDEIISVKQEDGSSINKNAGKTKHQGIEYGLNYQPIQDFKFRVSGTNATHEYVDYTESGKDYAHKKMQQAPQWIFNTQLTYYPRFLKGFRTSIEWQKISSYYTNAANTKSYEGYNLFNLRVAYEWKAIEIWANVLNLDNKLYSTNTVYAYGKTTYTLGDPRNINVGLAFKFSSK